MRVEQLEKIDSAYDILLDIYHDVRDDADSIEEAEKVDQILHDLYELGLVVGRKAKEENLNQGIDTK